jgi:hypothetical protein
MKGWWWADDHLDHERPARLHDRRSLRRGGELKGIIPFRFDTSELGSTWTEICAYGTAVRVHKR